MKSNSVSEQSAIFTFDKVWITTLQQNLNFLKMFRMSDSPSRMFIECQYRLCDEECSNVWSSANIHSIRLIQNCSSTSIPSGSITTLIDVVDGEPATIRAGFIPSFIHSSWSSSSVSSSSIREVSSSSFSFILNFLLFLLTLSTCIGASLVTLIILTRSQSTHLLMSSSLSQIESLRQGKRIHSLWQKRRSMDISWGSFHSCYLRSVKSINFSRSHPFLPPFDTPILPSIPT